MTPINPHPWLPLRELLGSFPIPGRSFPIAPRQLDVGPTAQEVGNSPRGGMLPFCNLQVPVLFFFGRFFFEETPIGILIPSLTSEKQRVGIIPNKKVDAWSRGLGNDPIFKGSWRLQVDPYLGLWAPYSPFCFAHDSPSSTIACLQA